MSAPAPTLMIAVHDQVAFVKISGRANVASSVQFKILFNELRERGFKKLVLDLSDCATMDSTFLGVLSGFVARIANGQPEPHPLCIELLNPKQRVLDLLENLGVAHLFQIIAGTNPAAENFQPAPPSGQNPSREEVSKTSLEAHQLLMAINPNNVPKFKDVTLFLAEDLKKISAEKSSS